MASTISKNKKNQEAAVKALDAAEAYFKLQRLDSAIKEATQAKKLDSNSRNVDSFITAYKIHKAVSCKKNWYVVLGIPECSNSLIISKRYKELALVVHPDKNVSAAAEGAFKHVKAALDYLSDPVRKKDYDNSLSKKKAYGAAVSCKSAATAAARRKAAEDAAADERHAESWEEELAAAAAAAARDSVAASKRKATVAAAAAAREAAAAAARNEINARKRRSNVPMSEVESGINLIMKHSSNYMARRFSVW